jgi:hypothetical protein
VLNIHIVGPKAFGLAKTRLEKLSGGGRIPFTDGRWTVDAAVEGPLGSSTDWTDPIGALSCSVVYLQSSDPKNTQPGILLHLAPVRRKNTFNNAASIQDFITKKIQELEKDQPQGIDAFVLSGRQGTLYGKSKLISDAAVETLQKLGAKVSTLRLFDYDRYSEGINNPSNDMHCLFHQQPGKPTTLWVHSGIRYLGTITDFKTHRKMFKDIQVAPEHKMHFSDLVLPDNRIILPKGQRMKPVED